MPVDLLVAVKPQSPPGSPEALQRTLFARLRYTREVPAEEEDEAEPTAAAGTFTIEGSRREEVDSAGAARLAVDDQAPGTPFVVLIESAQGTMLWTSPERTAPDSGQPEVTYPSTVFEAARRRPPNASPTLVRSGRFVRLDDRIPDFSRYRLWVAPILSPEEAGAATPQIQAVRRILGLNGRGEVTSFEATALDRTELHAPSVNAVGFQNGTIRADGGFEISIDISGDEVGWLWLLMGDEGFAGYQLDPVPTQSRPASVIMLPLPAVRPGAPPAGAEPSGAAEAPPPGGGPDCAGCAPDNVPMDYDERQLVDNPRIFSDDPGKFCTPFENPHRVLGERRFFTVLRVDQPEIGGQGSLKVSRPIVLDLARSARKASALAAAGSAITAAAGNVAASGGGGLSAPGMVALANAGFLGPARGLWGKWIRDRSKPRATVSGANPIEWDGDPTIYQAATVAGGHVLEWRVQWRSNGYSLGKVAHTLTLAPRQTKRIAKLSWRRRERAARRERVDSSDALSQVTMRDRDYTDAVQSSLGEWSRGGSESSQTGVAGGIGFALGPVVIGGGAAHGQASSSSWQEGGRRVAAAEQQHLRDAIRQYGSSVRSLESTVVTEISQEEDVEGVSETLRNVNYCHALSILYYEINYHLRVDTGFAGVRECLFVPFSVTPFDVDKALKWRDKLRHGIIDRSLRWALDRLDEVATNWVDSDIPPGRRMHHPVTYLTGSIYIQLSVDRPRDQGEKEALDAYNAVWLPYASLLGEPPRRIIEALKRIDRDRDSYFQREIAPTMATRWANLLEISIGGAPLDNADFTLATRYGFGGTVRIDFTAPISGFQNREQMQQIVVKAQQSLPPGSVANLKRMTLRYHTDHFEREVNSDQGARDMIAVDTGLPESGGAIARFGLTAWERQDLRQTIEDAVEKLIVHLNANLVYYHKVVWWLLDRDELYMMLDGFTAPYGRRFENGAWVEDLGRSIASVVERDPIAILGNSLVLRVAAGAFLGIDGHDSPDSAHRYYFDSQVRMEPIRVSLPTEGLYAQALMDKCIACEEHGGTTDWVLSDKDPELESLADQLGTRRAAPEELTPSPLPAPIIALQNAPNAPDPQGLAGVLSAVTNAGAFRDMAGLAGTQANAAAAMQTAASLASNFGNQAAALEMAKRKQAADQLDRQRASLERSVNSGIISREDAGRHLNNLHEQAAGGSAGEAPQRSTDELVTRVAQGLRPGQSGTVARATPAGGLETVSVESPSMLASLNWSQVPQQCGFVAADRVVPERDLRDMVARAAVDERARWIDPVTGQILGEGADSMFGRLVTFWISLNESIRPDTLALLEQAATDAARNYGQILAAAPSAANLNADLDRVRNELLAAVPAPVVPANLGALVRDALSTARLSRRDDANHAFWSAVTVSACVRRAAIAARIERVEQGAHQGARALLRPAMSHLAFTQEAYRRRFGPTGRTNGTYHAFEISEREPQVGDIIVQDRAASGIGGVMRFSDIPGSGGRALHSDIVVEAAPAADFVITIGGNVGDSVRRRRFPLTPGRRLIVGREQLYTTEDANQALPALPVTSTAALAAESTGRIFALLSPVEVCIVIPGTRVDEGVIV
jgi:hypothetical protein